MTGRPMVRVTVPTLLVLLFGLVLGLAVAAPVRGVPTELMAELSGDAEVPGPGDLDGTGIALMELDPETGEACFFIGYDGIEDPTAAHIHLGDAETAGDILVDIFAEPDTDFGTIEGCTSGHDSTLLQSIIDDPAGHYVNVHNAEFMAGAIRGQLAISVPPPTCEPPDLCEGLAPPGDYVFTGFAADLSFTLEREWFAFPTPTDFGLFPEEFAGELGLFSLNGAVFTETCGVTATDIPVSPQSYADFFTSNPHVTVVSAPQATTLGGANGLVLEVTGTGASGCEFGVALLFQIEPPPGFPPDDSVYVIGDGERIRIYLLDVAGQTIFIGVSDYFGDTFDELLAEAQPTLDSMVFALGGGEPTPAPTATATAAPLPDTAVGDEAVPSASSALAVAMLLIFVPAVVVVAVRRARRH